MLKTIISGEILSQSRASKFKVSAEQGLNLVKGFFREMLYLYLNLLAPKYTSPKY